MQIRKIYRWFAEGHELYELIGVIVAIGGAPVIATTVSVFFDEIQSAALWLRILFWIGVAIVSFGVLLFITRAILSIITGIFTNGDEPKERDRSSKQKIGDHNTNALQVRDIVNSNITISGSPSQHEQVEGRGEPSDRAAIQQPVAEDRVFRNQTIFLPALAQDDIFIFNYVFDNCEIRGPAIIGLVRNVTMSDSTFIVENDDLDTILFEVPDGNFKIGAIGVRDCEFRKCTFVKIGIVGTQDTIEMFRSKVPTQSNLGTEGAGRESAP